VGSGSCDLLGSFSSPNAAPEFLLSITGGVFQKIVSNKEQALFSGEGRGTHRRQQQQKGV
jgi:hypothetical protein